MNIAGRSTQISGKDFIRDSVNGITCQISQLGISESRKKSENECMAKLGFKQCPICCNKLYSSVLLLEHLKVKHPKTKVFKCNVCTKKSIRGAVAFVNHIDLCHDSCNAVAEDARQLPFVKTASKTANSVACNQIQLIVCERHGKAFPTNYLADKHRIRHGNALKPCFMIKMQGVTGSSEELLISSVSEEYNKIRLCGYKKLDYEEYKRVEFNYSFPEEEPSPINGTQLATQAAQNYPAARGSELEGENWNTRQDGTSVWGSYPPNFRERDEMFSSYVYPHYAEPQTPYSQTPTTEQNRYNNN